MTRREEFDRLRQEAALPPETLAGCARRAVRKGRRRKLLRPLATVAGAAACFAVLVNASLPFALAAHGVPVVRELVSALAFLPGLKEALAHDYAQYLGYSMEDGGVQVTLEYLFADPGSMTVFYRLRGVEEYEEKQALESRFQLTSGGDEVPAGFSWSWPEEQGDGLRKTEISFENGIVREMELTITLLANEERMAGPVLPDQGEAQEAPAQQIPGELDYWFETEPDYRTVAAVTFPLHIDERLAQAETVFELGETAEVFGQRLVVERVKLFPSQTEIYWHEEEGNTAWLRTVRFSLRNRAGETAGERANGIIGKGGAGDKNRCTILGSVYFTEGELWLSVDSAELLEKGRENAYYDPETGFTGLPEGVAGKAEREGDRLLLTLRTESSPEQARQTHGILGTEINGTEEEGAVFPMPRGGSYTDWYTEDYATIEGYTGGRVAIPLRGGPETGLPEPVRIRVR